MHEEQVSRLGGLSRVVRLTDRPDRTMVVYRGRIAITQNKSKS